MQRIERSIEIKADPAVVFDFVADPLGALSWMHNVTRFEPESSGPPLVGARVTASAIILGIPLTTTLEVTDVDRPHRLASSTAGRLRTRSIWEFAPILDGTRVTFIGEYDVPAALLRLIGGPMALQELESSAETSLRNLKSRIEER
ncbi:MAG: hypothetical protein EPO26_14340 [Chloroflexota bacterium]|nr:MAG: hypothetical protein EPO26_14340 [Chloroflexota bacterium]